MCAKKTVKKVLDRTSSFIAKTPIATIPGVKRAYGLVNGIVEPTGPVWTQYRGIPIYVDPRQSVESQIYHRGEYEPLVTDCIDNHMENGMLSMDIGAHVGVHTIPLHQAVGQTGKVIAFEPNPIHFEKLSETIERNDIDNIELINVAVSNEAGQFELYEKEGNKGHSTLQPHPDFSYEDGIEVEVISIMDFIEDRGLENIDLLKIDIEGKELDVIKGLNSRLADVSMAIIEIHGRLLDEEAIQEVYDHLNRYGSFQFIDSNPSSAEEHVGQDLNVFWTS